MIFFFFCSPRMNNSLSVCLSLQTKSLPILSECFESQIELQAFAVLIVSFFGFCMYGSGVRWHTSIAAPKRELFSPFLPPFHVVCLLALKKVAASTKEGGKWGSTVFDHCFSMLKRRGCFPPFSPLYWPIRNRSYKRSGGQTNKQKGS